MQINCALNMSVISTRNISYASSMQCYVCIYNQACKLKTKQLAKDETIPANVECRGCKLQRYCSLKHLIEDREHHEVCGVLTKLQKSLNIAHPLLLNDHPHRRMELQRTVAQLMLATRLKLGRKLTPRERQLIGYPSYCMVCYSLDTLTACSRCEAVAYCCSEHRRQDRDYHTREACDTLALYYSPYRFLESQLIIANFKLPCDLEQSCLVEAFYRATRMEINSQPWSCLEDYEKYAACSSFSGISSICLALTTITFVAAPHETLHIYVVGATEEHRHYFQEMHLKFFFLQYQSICQLVVSFIGHELKPQEEELVIFNLKGSKRKVFKRTFSMTFVQFAKCHKVDPVLIMIYNPDFSALKKLEKLVPNCPHLPNLKDSYSWNSCVLETLYIYNVPICITSLTKMQFHSNIAFLNEIASAFEIEINNAYDCEENPYREILPYPNLNPDDSETIIYANNYLKVIYTSV
ncbi:uncharacterized protein LOC132798533 [Drosophila nasuta]|uniref:uncharacterized protein LOC132798533 n=1 Tax=Drosophila nasuta TaxID=42062 RepID=UPI00295EBFE9|nr:uncharacterized protein LOC132798533 [Drosophila nasuta]